MGKASNRLMAAASGSRCLALILIFTMLLSVLSGAAARPAAADSVRTAYVTEVSGQVSYKKAGGSRWNSVYVDLTLNEGDYISTGASSSVVLRISDSGDQITVGANSELYMAGLSSGQGKLTKIKSWAGSVWSKVKSLVSADDEYEIETPTGTMGVRGTHFLIYVDPKTGASQAFVSSGVVSAQLNGSSEGAGTVQVYPAQQISLDQQTQPDELKSSVGYVDAGELVSQVPAEIIEKILKSASDIQKEQEQMKKRLQEQLGQGERTPEAGSVLQINSQSELDKVKQNFDVLLAQLAKKAVDAQKVDAAFIESVNSTITEPGKKFDLNVNPPEMDNTAGMDPAIVHKPDRPPVQMDEQLKENQGKLESLLQQLERARLEREALNRKAEQEAQRRAEEKLLASMTEEQRQQYEQAKAKNEASTNGAAQPDPTDGDGDSSSGGSEEPGVKEVALVQNGPAANGQVNLRLQLRNFTVKDPFYSVQVHLVYDRDAFAYTGELDVSGTGTLFDESVGAETLREVKGAAQSELIYAASRFQSDAGQTDESYILQGGVHTLVNFPLQVLDAAAAAERITVAYIKVLDENGVPVYQTDQETVLTVNTK